MNIRNNSFVLETCSCDEYKTLKLEDGTIVLEGDEYHDKITARISGLREAARVLDIKYTLKTIEIECKDHD